MSTLKVEVVYPDKISVHPNADRLDVAEVKGWNCVVGKGLTTKAKCVYFPIDSVLPDELAALIFSDTKIKPVTRIKTIKLRGVISQGLLVSVQQLRDGGFKSVGPLNSYSPGHDVTAFLGVTRYEPKVNTPNGLKGHKATAKQTNPYFKKYTGIENYKNHPNVFKVGEQVIVYEKIHGTNFRAGWVPTTADTWWKKCLDFFGRLPAEEFVYGSHNVQLQNPPKKYKKTFYSTNVYVETVRDLRLKERIPKGHVIYGEIYGDGIQKGYNYGMKHGHYMRVFDVKHEDVYFPNWELRGFCTQHQFDMPPHLFKGKFDIDVMKKLASGKSTLWPKHDIEGIVIRPEFEAVGLCGRKILKLINDEYLLKKQQTEFH